MNEPAIQAALLKTIVAAVSLSQHAAAVAGEAQWWASRLGASLVFRISNDAFLVREMSTVMLEASSGSRALLSALRLVSGAVLAVFGPGMRSVMTGLVTGAIRGTGIYVEASPARTYFCTCYGNVGLSAADGTKKDVIATNHTAHYIHAKADAGGPIFAAPLLNHSNQELAMLEKLAGRKPRLKTDAN